MDRRSRDAERMDLPGAPCLRGIRVPVTVSPRRVLTLGSLSPRRAWLLLAALACGEGESPVALEAIDLASVEYAPSLGVDISKMRRYGPDLYIRDLEEGDGAAVQRQRGAVFDFEGWLHDGTQVERGVYPARLLDPGAFVSPDDGQLYYLVGSGQTIAAWDLALPGIREGGVRQVVAAPAAAYGASGSLDGRIPPNAVLVYVFRMRGVEP